jgi:hypothetical protein
VKHNLDRAREMIAVARSGRDPFGTGSTAESAAPQADEGSIFSKAQADFAHGMQDSENNRAEAAMKKWSAAIDLLSTIRSQGSHGVDTDALYALSLTMKGAATVDQGDLPAAKALLSEAAAVYADLVRRDPKNSKWKNGEAIARQTLSRLQ